MKFFKLSNTKFSTHIYNCIVLYCSVYIVAGWGLQKRRWAPFDILIWHAWARLHVLVLPLSRATSSL